MYHSLNPSEKISYLLPDLFEEAVKKFPQRRALQFRSNALSYQELDQRASLIARSLIELGAGPGRYIGLWMSRSLELPIALLAILKTGAAYIPFDRDTPPDRVKLCLDDSKALCVIIDDSIHASHGSFHPDVVLYQSLMIDRKPILKAPLCDERRAMGMTAQDPAYIIYTSGSTGVPKGVLISQSNICHFLQAAQKFYQFQEDDIVFQGASIAFDLSLEEIFLTFLSGACLWVAGHDHLQDPEKLSEIMIQAGITILDTVPTLLSLLSPDNPSLRLILTGGEALPPLQVERWSRPYRRMINSYGPTETTVVATATDISLGQKITIGRPLEGYHCFVVNDSLDLLGKGVEGELLIGGPAVALGYLNRPDLTAQKFIPNPFREFSHEAPILYRTGDAVQWNDDGTLTFLGRLDDQVKLRGFRIELGEIEECLQKHPAIAQAAVLLRKEEPLDSLVAFIVPKEHKNFESSDIKESLRDKLPSYMIPQFYQKVEQLPLLTSGKIDRKTLHLKANSLIFDTETQEQPESEIESILLSAAKIVFKGQSIPFNADFFLDLGGHSLLAAQFVSLVRKNKKTAYITLNSLYECRTLRQIGQKIEHHRVEEERVDISQPPPFWRHFLCGVAQAIAIPFFLLLTSAPWLGVFISYQLFSGEDYNFWRESSILILTFALINLSVSLIAIIGKWVSIGQTKEGTFPLWGTYYFRWWIAQRFIGLIHWSWLQGSPLIRIAMRLLGACIDNDVTLGDIGTFGAIDLVSIGEGSHIGGVIEFANAEVIGHHLCIGKITLGKNVQIGSSCTLSHSVTIEDGVELEDLTAIQSNSKISKNQKWEGSPAVFSCHLDPNYSLKPAKAPKVLKIIQLIFYSLMLVILPPVALIPIIPAFYVLDNLSESLTDVISQVITFDGLNYVLLPIVCWPAAMVLMIVTVLFIALIRWVFLPRIKTGIYSIYGWFYLRKWVVSLALDITIETLFSLNTTAYMRGWYRLMGLKIGKNSEISTNPGSSFDLLTIGEDCFIADGVILGDETIRQGWLSLSETKIGQKVFVGNSAVLPLGSHIPEGTLIGVKSKPPHDNRLMTKNSTWFGSPPLLLPVRQDFHHKKSNLTYRPSKVRRLGRMIFEAFSASFPSMIYMTLGSIAVDRMEPFVISHNYKGLIPIFMMASIGISISLSFIFILYKWMMVGRFKPTSKPMWSWWALRSESVALIYWAAACYDLLDHLKGTPFLPWFYRLLGAKIGRRVYIDSYDLTEFDCISIGDFSNINSNVTLQTHLYEDRIMKVGTITIGRAVSISSGSTILYDTKIGDYAQLGPLTIIMKGEEIQPHSAWQGAPSQRLS